MKRLLLSVLLLSGSAVAQDTSYRDGDRMSGVLTTSPQGQAIIAKIACTDATNVRISCGGSGGGGSTNGNTLDVQGTSTLALGTANAAYSFTLSGGRNTVGLTITGLTGSGATLTAERSNDGGTTWTNANTTESSATASLSATITADGQARVGVAGATNLRLRVSTAGTGTATIAYNATTAAGPIFLTSLLPTTSVASTQIIGGVNNQMVAGSVISVGTGASGTGTQRVVLASDSPLAPGAATAANQNSTAAGTSATNAQGIQGVTGGVAVPISSAQEATIASNQTNGTAKTQITDSAGNLVPVSAYNGSFSPSSLGLQTRGFNVLYDPVANGFVSSLGNANGALVQQRGTSNGATGQVSVGTTATLIRAADAGRSSIQVIVGAANQCAFGFASNITLTTGYALPATAGVTDTTATNAAWYGVCSAATTVSYKVTLP